jgi:uncharacterized protein YjbI with pentapeptide repeats
MAMADEEHLRILKQGVEVWNEWRIMNPDIRPDLSEANLSQRGFHGADLHGADLGGAYLNSAHLRQADFSGANLSRACLYGADLRKADLFWADLSRADLYGANLNSANLSRADLSEAVFTGAYLSETNLSQADLSGADLSGAIVVHATFANLDLSAVKGLDAVIHHGPSTIGVDTLYKSHGQIPEAFLRGCGVPDNVITYIGSLTGKAFEYYSCFISYSTKDEAFAQRLHADLQAKGVRCWFAPKDVAGGKKLYEQIDRAIRVHDKLLLVLSEHSIGSQWVMTEIRRTRKAELRDKRQKLFPIRLVDMDVLKEWECFDADAGKDLAVEVREYFVPDFSTWKDHDAYQRAFDHLLRDLKAEEG